MRVINIIGCEPTQSTVKMALENERSDKFICSDNKMINRYEKPDTIRGRGDSTSWPLTGRRASWPRPEPQGWGDSPEIKIIIEVKKFNGTRTGQIMKMRVLGNASPLDQCWVSKNGFSGRCFVSFQLDLKKPE